MSVWQRPLIRYAFAVGAVAAGFLLREALTAWVGPGLPNFVTFYPAVMAAALFGGLGPGLVATLLAALVVDYRILEPVGSLTISSWRDAVGLGVFSCMGALISTVVHLYHRARRKAAAYDREVALRETRREREFLANLVENASQPFAVGYPEGRMGLLNRAYEQLTGYSAAELRALDWSRTLTPPEWREMEKEKLDELHRTGQPVRYEKEYVRKDGSRVPVELLVHLVCNAEGKPEYYYSFLTDITERRRTEQSLRASLNRYLSFLEVTGQVGWTTDADGLVVEDMPAWRKFTGQSIEGISGWGWSNALHPDDLAHTAEAWKAAVEARTTYATEYRLRRHDGVYRDFLARGVPVLNDNGSIREWVGTCIDITDRKQAEEQLRQFNAELKRQVAGQTAEIHRANETLEQRIAARTAELQAANASMRESRRAALNLMDDAVAARRQAEQVSAELRESEARLSGVNRILEAGLANATEEDVGGACLNVAEEITGSAFGFVGEIGPDGLLHGLAISDPDWEACAIQDKTGHRQPPGNFPIRGIYGRVLVDGKSLIANDPPSHPDCIGVPDGHPPLMAFLGVPLMRDGKTFGMIAVGNRPGGYRREDQEALESLAPAIVEALARKRAEKAMERLASFPTLNPNPIVELDMEGRVQYVNPTTQRLFPDLQQNGLAHPWLVDWESVALALRNDDARLTRREVMIGEKWYRQTIHYLPEIQRVRLYGLDITDRKQAEEALQRTADQLARSNQELEQFAYVASHDLQEPLRVVNGYVQLIERKYKNQLDADADQFFRYIVDGVTRMQQLITDLLNYSRIGTRGKPFGSTSVHAVLDRVLANLETVVEESGATVTYDSLPTVQGDETQLVQLFQNLIGNGIKFHGDRPPQIEISARRNETHWEFAVRDNGIGIDREYWEQIFVIFQRLHTRQKYAGTGIGLAICKRIVERHGGRIWLDSQPGQGTTFYFTIS